MKIIIRRFYNHENVETGSVLTVFGVQCNSALEKENLERVLRDYAFNELYKHQGLHIYSDINGDMPSITVLKNLNEIPEESITLNL